MANTTDDHTTDDGMYIQTNSGPHDQAAPDDGTPLDPTDPATDTNIEEIEVVQEGLGGAAEKEDPAHPTPQPLTTEEGEQVG